jgi:N-acylneuraminate cytidylyltransferase
MGMFSGINLAIIPARGGSKRIPKKNLVKLGDKPLIYHTIAAAKKSEYLNRVIVSTDDEEIAKVSEEFGAEVVKRPPELATDESPMIDTVFHVIETLKKREGTKIGLIVLLQPSTPLRTNQDIDDAIQLFKNNECESIISVSDSRESPFWSHIIENKYLIPLLGMDNYYKRSQDLPKTYMENGALYILTPDTLNKYRSFYTPATIPYKMPFERSIDIDDQLDLILAETLMGFKSC